MQSAKPRPRVLFLCTGNSCRSQMAEGWARALKSDSIDAYSAGTAPHGLNPLAVRAMAEVGLDISRYTSKRPEDCGVEFDFVVTVCDAAHESCPIVSGARVVHVGFDDPPRLAQSALTGEEAMPHYRRVRDEIRAFVETLPAALLASAVPLQGVGGILKAVSITNPSCCGAGCECAPQSSPVSDQSVSHGAESLVAADALRAQVREGYARIAESGWWSEPGATAGAGEATSAGGCCVGGAAGGGCCGPATFTPEQLATAIGYSQGELAVAPEGANMGLSCGNPTAIATLLPGEVVLDLGSGGGFDCFIAGAKVGATGRVIGIDMTPEMLSKARRNAIGYAAQTGHDNVEFRLGEIEHLPVADASVDVVLSNCVFNLSPDKPRVWRELARVLKPGGRVAVSDIALLRPLPVAVLRDLEALVGCVAGAVLVDEMRAQASAAGLGMIVCRAKPEYIEALTDWSDPLYVKILSALPAGSKPSEYITSVDMTAVKPR